MGLTLRHLVNPHKVTVQYPEEKWQISPQWRGTHRMLTTETGKAKCVACGLCPTVCPANCIKLVPGEDEEGNRYPLIFEIDEFRCIFCGYCQEVCPEEAIHVGRHYENSEYSLSLIHISEPTRLLSISYAVFCLKKKKTKAYHG